MNDFPLGMGLTEKKKRLHERRVDSIGMGTAASTAPTRMRDYVLKCGRKQRHRGING